ncbi:hypothetical protein CQA66_01085 [Helicobacter aurati]|uniref:Flagellar protein FliL n=1 Tax=Helicobacter aurati TaxID=137778 RepID=A0A3D8J8Q2_9HELI|nr:flagellar basal body-associated FliL family protein [Helicobacter aurati]RDU73808.1 hypothetical protein CQA66_01085 [Helicobacter aurati]
MFLLRKVLIKTISFFIVLGLLSIASYANDMSSYYGVYKNAKQRYLIEKEFTTNLKLTTPDDIKSGGFTKFKVTLLFDEKNIEKEIEAKIDIIRSIIVATVNGFEATTMQSSSGRKEVIDAIVAGINAILTTGQIQGAAFGDLVVQF